MALLSGKYIPTVAMLKKDFEAAKVEHDARIARRDKAKNAKNVTGDYDINKKAGKSKVKPRIVQRNAEWVYAEISEPFLESEKLFTLLPVAWDDVATKDQNEVLLNWQFNNKIGKQLLIDRSVLNFVDEGFVVAKVGWKQDTVDVSEDLPVWSYEVSEDPQEMAEQADKLEQAIALQQTDEYSYKQLDPAIHAAVEEFTTSGIVTIPVATGYVATKSKKVVDERPIVQIVDQANLYLDPTAKGDMNAAKFATHLFPESRAVLEKSNLYSNLDQVNWDANGITTDSNYEAADKTSFTFNDAGRKQVLVYEYWGEYDLYGKNELHPIVAAWIGDVLVRMELNPYPDKSLPFVAASYKVSESDYDGEAEAMLLVDSQAIIGGITRGVIDTVARGANGQRGVPANLMNAVNFAKFEKGDDFEYNPLGDFKSQVYSSTFADVPQSALSIIQWQNAETEAFSGTKTYANGGLNGDSFGAVATGVNAVSTATAQRKMGVVRRYSAFIAAIGSKIVSMNQAFLSEDQVVRVTSEEFVPVVKSELIGNYDTQVTIATRQADQDKANRLAMMLQTLGNTLPFDITKKMMVEYAKLERMNSLAHDIANTQAPEPTEGDQLELAKLRQQVAKLESDAALNAAETIKRNSEAALNVAKLQEQTSGVAHERSMDKQAAQAEANQNLEITKSILDGGAQENPASIAEAISYAQLSKQLN